MASINYNLDDTRIIAKLDEISSLLSSNAVDCKGKCNPANEAGYQTYRGFQEFMPNTIGMLYNAASDDAPESLEMQATWDAFVDFTEKKLGSLDDISAVHELVLGSIRAERMDAFAMGFRLGMGLVVDGMTVGV